MKLGEYELNQIYTGDARELAKGIPDESVDLIFTDPVYENIEDYRWLAESAARILKPDSACLVFTSTEPNKEIMAAFAMRDYLHLRWRFILYTPGSLLRCTSGWCHYTPLYWLEKGKSKRFHPCGDVDTFPVYRFVKNNHRWNKPPAYIMKKLQEFIKSSGIVIDPFCGGGTIPSICKELNISYLAFEINSETAEKARQRVAETQNPLPLEYQPMQEQLFMAEILSGILPKIAGESQNGER